MNTYTTRQDAITAEIVAPIEATGIVEDAHTAYDIDAIADATLGDYADGYASQVDEVEFWTIVEQHAR